ncbi:MAG: chemotaxis protein CheA, partial [Burkholderiaceae bacterium]|nr:chemotaxis protein CheA [Burkholderiaceae bacterium]
MNMEQALQTYIAESRGLLHEMEDALLGLEHDPANEEMIGALFRAAHTIKGSAGLFGLDPVVAFTHVVENLLDQLRDGAIAVCEDLIGVLLACCDHIGALIDRVAEAGEALDANQIADGERLLASLRGYLGQAGASQAAFERAGAGPVAADSWLITVQFGPEVLRNGMDPASFLRYLASIGQIVSLRLSADAMPALDQLDPEACYLGFEIGVCGVAGKQAIEDVFEFVREDCKLRIEAPPSHWSQQAAQIEKSAGTGELLGEILTEAGVLTPDELDRALAVQDDGSAPAAAHPPLGQVLVGEGLVPGVVVDVALEKQKQIREQKMQAARFIRVSADKLDQLINRVGELVIAGASASLLAQSAKNAPLQEATAVISRFVEEIREDALRLRMVEIGETFNRFQRVVRDVSRDLGKDIELEIGGAETELDKTVIEKIGDPLTHLVRNAIDHGIEDAARRAACGKPARGKVRLNAYHDSGSIVIEVGDDGGGLSRAKILAKAIERGIVAPDAQLTDGEVFKLIFAAGFSTAAQVTNLSGRGVGLDVVKRNIEALRGTVDIDSREGEGSTVRIRLPLTLAIIDGFLVGVGRSS